MFSVVVIRSAVVQSPLGWLLGKIRSMAPARFRPTAPPYQSASTKASTVATGSRRSVNDNTPGFIAVASVVVAMPTGQALAHLVRQRHELGRVAQTQVAMIGQRGSDDLQDAPGARAHHHDAGAEVHRLGDRVGDEHHRAPLALPQLLQLVVEAVAGDLVERAEGLV